MKPILSSQEVNVELETLKRKLGVATEVILPGLPRTFSRKNVRFELPLDRKRLKGKRRYVKSKNYFYGITRVSSLNAFYVLQT